MNGDCRAAYTSTQPAFADRLLAWFATHGRHDLPWQHPRSPWAVWVSEIMLQQTQVTTVVAYFNRFMARFPTPAALAQASEDEVLALWSGLGYYSRARNLHAAAQRVVSEHAGMIPADFDALHALPGIGDSTAAAICAQAFGLPHAILDANVKRVLSRHAGIEGWPGQTRVHRALQAEADARLPSARLADYTQAMMDLGARLCSARAPDCAACPVSADCVASAHGLTATLPTPRPRRERPERHGRLLLIRAPDSDAIWLQRRAPTGIWGGLWAPPIIDNGDTQTPLRWGLQPLPATAPPTIAHGFTHFIWHLQPSWWQLADATSELADDAGAWLTIDECETVGLPAPIRKLFNRIKEQGP